MQDVARIVLAVESEHLAQDVIDFLDRTGRTRVVDSVRDSQALAAVVERERPDAVVGSPDVVRTAGRLNGSSFLAVATEESVRVLRDAVDAGADGFFVWPGDRTALGQAAARTAHPQEATVRRARVVAVIGARGGAGATFVASHLAAAFAGLGKATIAVDAGRGELAWALGAPVGEDVKTIADLWPVRDEIEEEHVRNALWSHPSGMRVLLAPERVERLDDARLAGLVEAAARLGDIVLLHEPPASARADLTLVVATPDVFAFRAARRTVEGLPADSRWEIVVNRAGRGRIVPGDVERVFGRPAFAALPAERTVPEAQDRGELLAPRSRLGRAMARLARRIAEEPS